MSISGKKLYNSRHSLYVGNDTKGKRYGGTFAKNKKEIDRRNKFSEQSAESFDNRPNACMLIKIRLTIEQPSINPAINRASPMSRICATFVLQTRKLRVKIETRVTSHHWH